MKGDIVLDRIGVRSEWTALVKCEQSLAHLPNLDRTIRRRRERLLKRKRKQILKNAIRLAISFEELRKIKQRILSQ